MLQTGVIDWRLVGATPPVHATFLRENLQSILDLGSTGIRFYSAKVSDVLVADDRYDSIMAVGFNSNGNMITGNQVLADSVPCPPECHFAGATSTALNPLLPAFEWLSLVDAQTRFLAADEQFAVEVPRNDIEDFFALTNFAKLRVHYAWTTPDPNTRTRTFLLQGSKGTGNPILNVYLHIANPIPNPVL